MEGGDTVLLEAGYEGTFFLEVSSLISGIPSFVWMLFNAARIVFLLLLRHFFIGIQKHNAYTVLDSSVEIY